MNEAETQRLESLYQQKLTALDDLKNPSCIRPSPGRCNACPRPASADFCQGDASLRSTLGKNVSLKACFLNMNPPTC
jgi:hypothetical protein